MRIIGGRVGGIRLNPPKNLPVRPTTDLAKEALFNILNNRMDLEGLDCLDLFAGTGNVSFELASRGASSVCSVDKHYACVKYIKEVSEAQSLQEIKVMKSDVFDFIMRCKDSFDFIFADPPYDLPELLTLPKRILEANLLRVGGTLVVEHPSTKSLANHACYEETRRYGYSSFSFYSLENE